MNEIKCPHCGNIFNIKEEDYNSIIKQIRDIEFNKEIELRLKTFENEKKNAIKLSNSELENKYNDILAKQNLKIKDLENKLENEKNQISANLKLKEIDIENKYSKISFDQKNKITELENSIKEQKLKTEILLKESNNEKDKEIIDLKNKLENSKNEFIIKEKSLIDAYNEKIKDKDEQIAYYKDFKAKQSTKMIGESLEQHCSYEFNKLRPIFGVNTYFEKDNDAKSGSKGDFIFRDYDEEGNEIISIMFEMKNEADTTSTKHKNEDFLKELDKDRNEKKCEYAVLVSLLETDNELYNNGIVDVSHRFEKMYVIRPQFFIPIITLLRNAALNSLKYKKQLKIVENQNIDISHFEENINAFKEGFARNYRIASEKFSKAIEEIDKTIDHLQKTKDALISSENQLRLANNKADDLSIKKLTHNSKLVQEMFENLNSQ